MFFQTSNVTDLDELSAECTLREECHQLSESYTATTKTFSFDKATTDFPLFIGKVSCEQMSTDSIKVIIPCRGDTHK